MKLKTNKPKSEKYPNELNNLGDHLRKRRLDLGLLQREVAERIGVDETSIYNWERQRTQPETRIIARIIEFLGYDPFPEPKSFPEKLKTHRLKLGLSQAKLAFKLELDPGTVRHWEAGRHRPINRLRELIESLIKGEKRPQDREVKSITRNTSALSRISPPVIDRNSPNQEQYFSKGILERTPASSTPQACWGCRGKISGR